MAIALLTTYLSPYRVPLYQRLADRHGVEVLCYGGAERYAPPWFTDLDRQLASAPFPARRLTAGVRGALGLGRSYDAAIAGIAGGAMLPAAYAGAKAWRRPFVLWASVWAHPRSPAHAVAKPALTHIYRHADAVVAYGEHVRRFVAGIRGRDDDVVVAPQAVEPELFARTIDGAEQQAFRDRHQLGDGPLVLYVGRLASAKGIEVMLRAWAAADTDGATLAVIGDGPLAAQVRARDGVRFLGPMPRPDLPAAYAAAAFVLVPSVPSPRFLEPWGLVCNEAMHQGRPVIASDAVGAVQGGLVRDGESGLVVAAGDHRALAGAIERLLADEPLRTRLGAGAQAAVAPYTYDAMAAAFSRAFTIAGCGGLGPVGHLLTD
jgi:glycosyltransferase involved in cell wall biosynthesis